MAEQAELVDNRVAHIFAQTFGLGLPTVISEVVDVAVAAVEIAPTGRLDQYGVDLSIQLVPLPIVAVIGAVVVRGGRDRIARTNFLDEPIDRNAVYLQR